MSTLRAAGATAALTSSQRSALHVGPSNGLPHDPLALVLYARAGADPNTGFAVGSLDGTVITTGSASLGLAPAPGADRRLTEPSGSFGGLKPPTNVAVSDDGTVYLVDRSHAVLKSFDPCDCAFKPLPCCSARPPGNMPETAAPHGFIPLTSLANPAGLAIVGASLLVADHGHHRIVVIGLIGLVPRGALRLPPASGLRKLWSPYGIAVDSQRRVYVSDADHGRIDVFGADGIWREAWKGLGAVTHLAVDCEDVLVAVIEDFGHDQSGKLLPAAVELIDGVPRLLAARPGALRQRFPSSPLAIDRAGRLTPGSTCADAFDLQGYPVRMEDKAAALLYTTSGVYRSTALDSRRRGCVWHRVVLAAMLPERNTISIATTTSDVELDATELADLPEEVWSDAGTIRSLSSGIGDALVRSPPGRYLWLRLTLTGDGKSTPAVTRIVVEFPRVSLRRYLPSVYGMDPVAADFTDRFTALFDTTLRSIENRIDTLHELFDPATAPVERAAGAAAPDFLTWLATWVGVSLSRHWPEATRRAMLKEATRSYTRRGTSTGLSSLLFTFLGFDQRGCPESCVRSPCTPRPLNCAPELAACPPAQPPLILEHFKLRRWLYVGAGRLGDDAMLWGRRIVNRSQLSGATHTGNARLGLLDCPPDSAPATKLLSTPDPLRDPFHVYAHKFTVFVPARVKMRDWQRRGLERLLAEESPAHTQWDIEYVEPRFRVGVQALIGFDSVIARVPRGIRLNDNRLGQGTVVPPDLGRPPLVGINARVGETTRLTRSHRGNP
jgi:phage tail-like protein